MADSSASVQMSMSEYMKSTAQGGAKPRNEFEHGAYMLDSEVKDEKFIEDEAKRQNMIIKFSQVVDKNIQLANIGDDKVLRLYQNDSGIMCDWLDMSIREKFIAHIFAPMYFGWRGELLMTHTKNGKMLDIQAAIGKPANPNQSQGGYGNETQEEDTNIIQKLLGKK